MAIRDDLTVEITVASELAEGSGIKFRCGYDSDINEFNMCFYWLLGVGDDPALSGKDKAEGDFVYLNQFDDVESVRQFLRLCMVAVDTFAEKNAATGGGEETR